MSFDLKDEIVLQFACLQAGCHELQHVSLLEDFVKAPCHAWEVCQGAHHLHLPRAALSLANK